MLRADRLDNVERLRRHVSQHGWSIGLDDAAFLCGNGFDGIAEMLLMITFNVRDHGHEGFEDVGRIKAPTHAHLNDTDLDIGLGKVQKRHRRYKLEKGSCDRRWARCRDLIDQRLDLLMGDGLSVDLDTLAEVDEMR